VRFGGFEPLFRISNEGFGEVKGLWFLSVLSPNAEESATLCE